ncbi:MAG: metallophosphoesterase [Acidobacteriota bacterium]
MSLAIPHAPASNAGPMQPGVAAPDAARPIGPSSNSYRGIVIPGRSRCRTWQLSKGAARLVGVVVCLICWHCGNGDSPSAPTPTPTPAPIPSPNPDPTPIPVTAVFVGAGDIGWCGLPWADATGRLLDGIGGTVFTAGDNAYPSGTMQNFLDCYEPAWGRHKGRTRPSPGNHEFESSGASGYFQYFGLNAGPPGLGYYSFEVGNWHAISLNSNIDSGASSAQGQWLRQDLAASRTKCAVAYWHHPLFTSGPNGDNPGMREMWRILYAAGVDVVINGHDHLYERFGPQDPDGRPDMRSGIRQFTAGTGGAKLYDFTPNGKANSEMQISAYGVLKLTLQSESYVWEFIPVSGRSDFGSGTCH